MAQQTEEQTSDEQTANNHGPVAVDCGNCGTEMDVDAEAIRLGGVIECPICEADVDLDEAGDGIDRGRGIETDGGESVDDWDPDPAELRDGETPDDNTHARVNAALARRARRILEDEDADRDVDQEVATDGGVVLEDSNDDLDGDIHDFNAIQEGEAIRLAVRLPAHGDVFYLEGEHVEDFLFATVLDVERFDSGDIREMEIEHRERGRLRVKWNGGIYPTDEPRMEPKKVAYHRGEVLRIGRSD